MSGDDGGAARTATVRTRHDAPELVRAALAPDNTASMDARVERGDDATDATARSGDAGGRPTGVVVCDIERGTTGGLRSTVDDYVVNLTVADRLVARGREHLATSHESNDKEDTPDTPNDT